MIRILLVVDQLLRPHRTGIDVYYDNMVHWLPRLAPDWNFALISFGEPDQQLPSFAPNLEHRGLAISRRRFRLTSMLKENSSLRVLCEWADLVHLLMPLPVVTNRPLFVTVHDLTPLLMPQAYRWYHRLTTRWTLRRLVVRNSHFNVVSDCTGKDLRNLFQVPAGHVHRVYEGVGEEFKVIDNAQRAQQVRARYHLPDRYFLFTGSMHKRKNLPTLLKAYRLFRKKDTTNTGLVLAGRMSLGGDVLKRRVQEYRLQKSVWLPGYIDSADLPTVIGGATALLYPSLYEGFGLPALEAMACSTPVIASRAGSIPEVTGGHALLCDPLDANGFAKAMHRIISDGALRSRLIEDGLDWAARFSWRSTAEATLRLYKEILDGDL